MTTTFVRTRHHYDSYSDYWRLVELAGYPTCYVDEMDVQDASQCYILPLLNGEWMQGWQAPKARIIHHDIEWRLDGAYPQILGVAETWASDPWYARQIGAKYVLLGSDAHLNLHPEQTADKYFDVVLLAYMTNRRDHIAHQLSLQHVSIAPRGWNEDRHGSLIRTRAMLQVHQHDGIPTIAPQRFALAAAYHMPMISEKVCEPGSFADAVLWADYHHLAETTSQHIRQELSPYADALYQLLCVERTFKHEIEAAL